ncbi:glycine betaine ABC transporter substrate-binding protein [Sphingobacterium sp. BIGb0165]|uniref:glycine betaine ABC transporter substrate-binding protein n=1 Tax=Sphingobacterium sp. BIGb0165 TaxID=2940615 RepID=UPI0021678FCC|nr:glycine betaine ABC transporter substrate-binding protein [Sphingobacterium sp. BIGb0165]MCS4226674.1 glycine betaine/proline transport system substrate-binding protein [Sphingobacterium sp. BIGb0165]
MMKIKLIGIWILVFLFSACNSSRNKNIIHIGMVDGWAEGVAMTYIAKAIMEEKGYHVVIQRATPDMILASMNNGDTDLYMDVWLPLTHGAKVAKFPNLQEIGTSYASARNGLVVPDYVSIDDIGQLKAHQAQFNNRIIGIEKGAGITRAVDQVIKDYNLNYKHINSSTVAMITELQNAIKDHRWIVVAGWQPHWMFAKMKLKFLNDPKKTLGSAEEIKIFARRDFSKDQPELASLFSQIHFDDATMADLLAQMEGTREKAALARNWLTVHRSLLKISE